MLSQKRLRELKEKAERDIRAKQKGYWELSCVRPEELLELINQIVDQGENKNPHIEKGETMEDKDRQYFNMVRAHAKELHVLLKDPQPGLPTWCSLFATHMRVLHALWENGSDYSPTGLK